MSRPAAVETPAASVTLARAEGRPVSQALKTRPLHYPIAFAQPRANPIWVAQPPTLAAAVSSLVAPSAALARIAPTAAEQVGAAPLPTFLATVAVAMPSLPVAPTPSAAKRWSVSSWALWRGGDAGSASLAPGSLGGAQAGVRATVEVAPDRLPGVALAARLSSPLRRRGLEAAVGVEWQPVAAVPVRLLAERRQRVSGEGRSAFALFAHGGVSESPLAGGFALDAYGAAGVVGASRRDVFAEGAASVTRTLGPLRAGAGAWGGVQPGVSRLDVGPTVVLPVRVGAAGVRLSLDYRVRVAGDASPGSGPALTIGTDF